MARDRIKIESNGAVVRFSKALGDINLSKKFWEDVGTEVESGILENIAYQKQANGSPLKRNTRATLERKLKLGRGARSLVDEKHRFVQGSGGSWKTKIIGGTFGKAKGIIVVPATGWLRRISVFVQEKGYTGWLGVNKKGVANIRKLLKAELEQIVKDAAKKANR